MCIRDRLKDVLLRVGLRAETEIVLRTGLEKFPNSRLLRVYLAETLSGIGRSAEALNTLEQASRLPASDKAQRALVFQRIGSVQLALNHTDDALKAYRQAVDIEPGSSESRIELGKAYFTVNRLEDAQAEFERVVREMPDNNEARLRLSETYLARGQWERAATAAERAIKLGTSDPRALYL